MDWRVIGGVVALVAAAGGGWQVRDWQADAAELTRKQAQEDTRKAMQELADKIDTSTKDAIANIRIENRTIHQKAIHEVQTNTVYAACPLPDAGRLLINNARASANAAGGTVPANAAAK